MIAGATGYVCSRMPNRVHSIHLSVTSSMRCLALACIVLSAIAPLHGQSSSQPISSQSLDGKWEFRALTETPVPQTKSWLPAQVPGVVQTDLIANKLIPDPFYRDNETRLQWIGESDWEYRTTFTVSPRC